MNTMSDTGSGKLVEESLKRKEKLRLLREKAQKLEQKNGGECGGQLSRYI